MAFEEIKRREQEEKENKEIIDKVAEKKEMESFNNWSYSRRLKLKQENPEKYRRFTEGVK